MEKPASWSQELFLSKHNLDAYACMWYDLDYESTPGREELKRVRRDAVWRETLRRFGYAGFAGSTVPVPSDWNHLRMAQGNDANRGEPVATVVPEASIDRALSVKERNNLLVIVGGLLELIQSPRPDRNSEAAIIREMLNNYSDKPAISKRNLEAKFAEAKRLLGNS